MLDLMVAKYASVLVRMDRDAKERFCAQAQDLCEAVERGDFEDVKQRLRLLMDSMS